MMKITIITVCYNSEKTIERTIKSVLSQTYKHIEYIIVDGQSTDNTMKIVNKYKKQITKIISEKDRGIYNAMNKAIKLATGDALNFMNANDHFKDESVVEDVVKEFKKHPKKNLLFGNTIIIEPGNQQLLRYHMPSKYYFFIYALNHQNIFCKRELFEKVGGFDEQFKVHSFIDWIIRVWKRYPKAFHHYDRTICVYDGTGVSARMRWKERRAIMRKNYNLLEYLMFMCIDLLRQCTYALLPKKVLQKTIRTARKKRFS